MASASGAVAAVAANAASHPYTCNTCQVAYRNIELQKAHMKSDWHRYNLKRRVASLPPITADVFTDKVLQARAASDEQAGKAYFERSCDACSKTFYSENAYQNHLLSQKHKSNDVLSAQRMEDETTSVMSSTFSLGEPIKSRSVDVDSDLEDAEVDQQQDHTRKAKTDKGEDAESTEAPDQSNGSAQLQGSDGDQTPTTDTVLSTKSCIFCNYDSPTAELNANHMERFHGMFIPEKPFLTDLDGLLGFLQQKVHELHECIFCAKFKSTVFAVQTHMRDKGHCKIPFETEEEQLDIGDFYDFRSTYSDAEGSDTESVDDPDGGATLKSRRADGRAEGNGNEEENGEDGWETDSSASSLDSEDLTAVPAEGRIHQFERLSKHPHHSRNDPRQRHQADGWHSHAHKHTHAVFHDEYELHLPSGKSVGHRSLNRYFRQNLTNYPTAEERAERQLAIESGEGGVDREQQLVAAAKSRGREVVPRGSAGLVGVSDERKKDIRQAERRGRDMDLAHAKKKEYAYGKKLNNQKTYYYRYLNGG